MTTGQNDDREFDVIIQGATGFTGTLVTEYLLRQYGIDSDLRWALAGRSEDRLREVRDALGSSASGLELIVADSFDKDALRALAQRTRVVLTTVGPYALYGSDLVAACVEAGTHFASSSAPRILDEAAFFSTVLPPTTTASCWSLNS